MPKASCAAAAGALASAALRLRSELGATMAAARRRVLAILKPHRLNSRFESEPLLRLMAHQPSPRRVKPESIQAFVRAKRPPHNNVCLFAVLVDGGVTDVSWLRAVRNLYGKHDRDADDAKRVIAAFRNEAHLAPLMQAARAAYTVGPCGDCGQRRKLAIDHAGAPFAQILDEFLRAQRADERSSIAGVGAMGAIPVAWSNGAHILGDRILSRQWREWHDERAQLVGLCRRCNCAKGSGGYRYTSFFPEPPATGGGAVRPRSRQTTKRT